MDATRTKKHTKTRAKEAQNPVSEATILGRGFDQVSDHVIITDKRGYILYANKAVETNTGYSIEEVIGKRPGDLWGGAMGREFYEKMWYTIGVEKKPFVGEVQNRRKDGVLYWQELRISPVMDEKGDVRFFIGIEENITDRKEKEKFRDEFEAIVSHQLRNPLQVIGLLAENLLQSKTMSGEEKEDIRTISGENKGISGFISDLQSISRTESGELPQESLDIGSEIERIVSDTRILHPHVLISYARNGNDFSLITNKSLAVQVFSNLIYNAAEYSDGKVEIVLKKDTNAYIFSVHNNGLEISAENAPKVFSKLFRTDEARRRKESGSGLGLHIAKTITDLFGWNMWFESAAGKGTTFYVKMQER